MAKSQESRRARAALDAKLTDLGSLDRFAVPRAGWIRAIRDALGMPAAELGRRLGVSHGAVFALERSEREGKARISTLKRAAEALDCTLVYAFIPKHGLEATVRSRAEDVVDEEIGRVQQSMALEDQAIPFSQEDREELVRELLNSRSLWNRRGGTVLAKAIAEGRADPVEMTRLLDGIDGAFERASQGLAESHRGDTIELDQL